MDGESHKKGHDSRALSLRQSIWCPDGGQGKSIVSRNKFTSNLNYLAVVSNNVSVDPLLPRHSTTLSWEFHKMAYTYGG
jgi:hypothetical protein